MSLQHAAKHLAAHGRGDDKVLVHMTHGELKSLNDLAMANGGHLTINPHTGLPEAGFLKAMLPMIIGAGLAAATSGTSLAMSPAMAGLVVGGGYAAATGSVKKGLQAGLGAYGGAGLSGGLSGAGASTMNTQATNAIQAANPGLAASEIGREMGTAGFVQPSIAASANPALASNADKLVAGAKSLGTSGGPSALVTQLGGGAAAAKTGLAAASPAIINTDNTTPPETKTDADQGQRYNFQSNPTPAATGAVPNPNIPSYQQMMTNPQNFGAEQRYFNPQYVKRAAGGPVEAMSNQAAMGANTMYPMANMSTSAFATPYQNPVSTNMLAPTADTGVGLNGEASMQGTRMATGGISDAGYNLGGYSDGGRLLRGPGDGVSDDIPAMIGEKQPARLADGEFVVPARIVSELGNGSTEAGARKLYAMMDRVQSARKKTVGKDRIAHNSRADKYLPA
jgi:hypothetical protein